MSRLRNNKITTIIGVAGLYMYKYPTQQWIICLDKIIMDTLGVTSVKEVYKTSLIFRIWDNTKCIEIVLNCRHMPRPVSMSAKTSDRVVIK